jgi:hypothetical protein
VHECDLSSRDQHYLLMAKGSIKSDWTVAYDPYHDKHLPYAAWNYSQHRPVAYWPADRTFGGELAFVGHERGRSSATVQLKDKYGFVYSMFLAEFMRLVPNMEFGRIGGTWGLEKNGSNTGIYRIDP